MLNQNRLKELFFYDESTGVFTRLKKMGRGGKGSSPGTENKDGYLYCMVDGKNYYLHRLAWLYVYGHMPIGLIDHINREIKDNRISNLRDVNNSENAQNRVASKNNKLGIKGVSYCKYAKKFEASITCDGIKKRIGYFKTAEDASSAYKKEALLIHKYNPVNSGKPLC